MSTCLRIQMIVYTVVNRCALLRKGPVLMLSALDNLEIRGYVHCFGWHHGVPELLQALDCAHLALLDSS